MHSGRLRQSCSPGKPRPVFAFDSVLSIPVSPCPMKSDSRDIRDACRTRCLAGSHPTDYGPLVSPSTSSGSPVARKGSGCIRGPVVPGELLIPRMPVPVGHGRLGSGPVRPWTGRSPQVFSTPGRENDCQLAEPVQEPTVKHPPRRAGDDVCNRCPADRVTKVIVAVGGDNAECQEPFGCAAWQRGGETFSDRAHPSNLKKNISFSPQADCEPHRGRARHGKPILASGGTPQWHTCHGGSDGGVFSIRGQPERSSVSRQSPGPGFAPVMCSHTKGGRIGAGESLRIPSATSSESIPVHRSPAENSSPEAYDKSAVETDSVPVAIEDFLGEGVPALFTRSVSDASSSDLSDSLSPCLPYYAAVAAATGQGLPFSAEDSEWDRDCFECSLDSRTSDSRASRDSSVSLATESGSLVFARRASAPERHAVRDAVGMLTCCPRCGGCIPFRAYDSGRCAAGTPCSAAGTPCSAACLLDDLNDARSSTVRGEGAEGSTTVEYKAKAAVRRSRLSYASGRNGQASESSWEDVEEEALKEAAKAGSAYAAALGLQTFSRCVRELRESADRSGGDIFHSRQHASQNAGYSGSVDAGQSPRLARPGLKPSARGFSWSQRGGLLFRERQRMSSPEDFCRTPRVL